MSWQPGVDQEGWQPPGWQPDAEVEAQPIFIRQVFRVRLEQACFSCPARTDEAGCYRIPPHPGVDPGESVLVEINLFELCANFLLANEEYDAGEFVRPRLSNGFSYEVTAAGLTPHRLPVLPESVGATVRVGSAVLTCRAAGSNGISALSAPEAEAEGGGLDVTDVSVHESTKIHATYSGGDEGQTYDVVYTFTLGGVTRVARQSVPVRKR